MRYKQTDDNFPKLINRYGCLFFSLIDIAEEFSGKSFTRRSIMQLYKELSELEIMRKDCYILNHTKVLQQALENFSVHDKVSYAGAWYNENITDRQSWGDRNGMFMILQFRTRNGNGHFRRTHYDPYYPLIHFENLMSIRYYDIGI